MKYIIKNCPALTDQGECYQGSVFMGTAFQECQERTDCVMKKIVFFCKMDVGSKDNMFFMARYALADLIIDMLGIEECENE